jgi:hypothetical protein
MAFKYGPRLLLDVYPQAFAAYSLRRLSDQYSGPAIRVRRDSDNTEQNINLSRFGLDTTSLSNFVGSGTGYITTWYDQSGNGNHVYGNVGLTYQPTIVESGSIVLQQGQPSIKFNGNQVLYSNTFNTTATSPFSILGVMYITAGGLFDGDNSEEMRVRTLSSTTLDIRTLPGIRAGYNFVWNQRNLYHFIFNTFGQTTSMGVNTTTIGTSTGYNPITLGGLSLGNSYTFNPMTGNMQEFIVFPYNITDIRLQVSSAINGYYGIY